MSALDVIRRVESLGGRLVLEDDGHLKVTAPQPLPEDVIADISAEKAAIMVALGTPLDTVVSRILEDIRPHLPPVLGRLSDDKLLALVNWSIIAAWGEAVRKLEGDRG